MNRLLSLFACMFLQLALFAQNGTNNDEYNPNNPPNPDAPATTYLLTLQATPNGAGSFNTDSPIKYEAGTQVYLYAYNVSNFEFVAWIENGDTISKNRNFYYVMPERDASLTAVFRYNPGNPANPESVAEKRQMRLESIPKGAGYFNWSVLSEINVDEEVGVYAYSNNGFQFREWQRDGQTVSTDMSYYFKMPTTNITLVAIYDYNPSNPPNPDTNYWNSESGEVIIDDFSPGYANNAIYNMVGGYDANVTMITIAGRVTSNDWYVARNFTQCSIFDMSRTTGLTSVPSWAFENQVNLTSVLLPASIERIDSRAFSNNTSMQRLTCYAITPPAVNEYSFAGVPDGMVVYVPAAAVAQYQEADIWKNFTILPLQDQVSALTVNLSDDENFNPAKYKDMYLELVNSKSGQKQRYVITDRISYTFSSLIHNTQYNIYLKNARGAVLGQIDNVEIGEDSEYSVTFESLMVPRDLTLKVLTPDNEDVTAQTTTTWMDEKDTYLTKGNKLTNQLEGNMVKYRIQLPQTLGMEYLLPEDQLYEVLSENEIEVQLAPIPRTTIGGLVRDIKTGMAISGANIVVSQTLNGLYSKSFTTKTDNNGRWSLTAFEAKTDITASMTDYVSKSQSFEQLVTEVPDFELKDINGTTISLNLTYTNANGETQNYYNDYANVAFTVFNKTKGEMVNELNVQYPQIVLMEQVGENTELLITATSKNQKFVAVEGVAVVDDLDRAEVTLPIKQLGGINASFTQTENRSVAAILYDANGRLVKKYDYTSATLTINELQDGQYTLVTMANSQFFNSIGSLSLFRESGLTMGQDYVQNRVTVRSGEMATVSNQSIPYLDETKLYYTGNKTSFTVNKMQVTAGQYLTLTSHLDFKSTYAPGVSEVNLIVNLPEQSSFVDNSVMVGNGMGSYTYDNHRVIIPLDNFNERVRFCIIPTAGGNYSPSASVQFKFSGKTFTQPIGNADFLVKDLSINVPSTVATTNVPVSGTAIGKSTIEIYDNGTLVGQTTSLANGSWATSVELDNPYNLSSHRIHAKVITAEGVEMLSETQTTVYDANAIQISKVVMYHNNPEMRKTYEVVYDFLSPTAVAQKYTYYIYNKIFTFTIDFTNNDPEKVTEVVLYVKTGNGSWVPVETTYNTNKKQWIASGEFGNMYDGNIPKNVAVRYTYAGKTYYDATDILGNFKQTTGNTLQEELDTVDQLFAEDLDEIDDDEIESIFADSLGNDEDADDQTELENATEEELEALLDEYLAKLDQYDFSAFINTPEDKEYGELSIGNFKVSKTDCQGKTKDDLLADGFIEMPISEEESVFVLRTADAFGFANLTENILVTITQDNAETRTLKASDSGDQAQALWNWETLLLEDKLLDKAFNEKIGNIRDFHKDWRKARRIEKMCKTRGFENGAAKWAAKKAGLTASIKGAAKNAKYIKYLKPVGKAIPFFDAAMNGYQGYEKFKDLDKIISNIPTTCSDQDAINRSVYLQMDIQSIKNNVIGYYTANTAASHGAGMGVAALGAAFPPSLIVTIPAVVYGQYRADKWFDSNFANDLKRLNAELRSIRKLCGYPDPTNDHGQESGSEDADPSIDPSGYVYEGVSSNRVVGATATAYYKEKYTDIYGDLYEREVLWNAAEYAQENPLFTDENGMYRWDVPQGLWRVKFEKEGYETTYSEWLPVPPPQLDVNIAMKQLVQPSVKSASAFDKGIDIEFDKYMDPESLTTDNIIVEFNDEKLDGTIELLNEEAAYEGQEQKYASKVRFNVPEGKELTDGNVIVLTVNRGVKSYAGTPMQEGYVQDFTVAPKVRSIKVDELINVEYEGTRTLSVLVEPVRASAGKTLTISSLSTMIATTNMTEVTLDEDGQAEVTITGELPGSTMITFGVKETDVEASMQVNVKEKAKLKTFAPRASRVSGTEVYRGTKIQLASDTEDATIYYTLDEETCPCDIDNEKVMVYDPEQPIVIDKDNMTIKAMAKGVDMEESEVVELHFGLKKAKIDYTLNKGWNWISHNMESPVATSEFQTNAERILSQTNEIIKDPTLGFVGNLQEMTPTEAYKVKVSELTEKELTDYEFNATANSTHVVQGWNWIGYPVNQSMSIDEALAFFEPAEGDYIVGQDGFAEYAEDAWNGSLLSLSPGKGYLLKSATSKDFVFNTTATPKNNSRTESRSNLTDSPWAPNKYAYPNVMPLTAQLFNNGEKMTTDKLIVGAFAGSECRGVGIWQSDRLLMTIYGESGEEISFVAKQEDNDRCLDITEKVNFTADNIGSWKAPFSLTLNNETTGIHETGSELTVTPTVARDHITVSANGRHISHLSITNMSGQVILTVNELGKRGKIAIGQLPEGMYIVTVQADGQSYYKKILRSDK